MITSKSRANVELKSYNNDWYNPGGLGKRCSWFIVNVIFFNNGFAVFYKFKIALLKLFGAKVGSGVVIKPSVNIKYPWFLTIGNNCWIGENVWIDNLAEVVIGNNVCISQGAMLLTGNHDYTKSSFDLIINPIFIEDGVWIGAKAVICPGVYCESHSILTVQSVATANMQRFTIYNGNPARAIKDRCIKPDEIN